MDVTAARQAEEALRRSESNLAEAQRPHAHRELGLAGSGKRRFASVRGMVPHIWLRSEGACRLGKNGCGAFIRRIEPCGKGQSIEQ